jgi:alcohol-forming fatty acyl-CoA reductase
VTSSIKEPLPGFIDNFFGAGFIASWIGLGRLHACEINERNVAPLIPVDYVRDIL